MRTSLLLFAMCAVLAGCSFRMSTYNVQDQNVSLIKDGRTSVNVVADNPGFYDNASILCRASRPVEVPEGQTFSSYITDALKSELSTAKLLNQKAANKLYVNIKRVDFSSAPGGANWYIDVVYKTDNRTFFVATVYHDRSAFLTKNACSNIAQYFPKAVAKHLHELYLRREFRAAIGASR